MSAEMNGFTTPTSEQEVPEIIRDSERFIDISGSGRGNRPKSHIILRYFEQYSDGTSMELDVLKYDKPIVSVFQHPGYVNVCLDYGTNTDADLRMTWNMLSRYSNPTNNMSYLPDEIESGYYTVNGVKRKVYFQMLELILSPIGKESEYEIHMLNPAYFTLSTNDPLSFNPCVLQLTFDASWVQVFNDLEHIDMNQLREEVMREMADER